jgi:WD40 repeat protein
MNHLIITAHGIRTYGDWQERLESLTRESRPDDPPEHMVLKYGFFSFLQYLIPPLRWVKVSLFCRELKHKLQSKNWDRIDMVGHSFGTYIIAHGLLKLAQDPSLKFKINTVILAGSVLKDNFPWQPLLNTRLIRLVNYCGTKDNVLLLNQLFVLFAGVAGRFGFSGGLGNNFRNRMFAFGHSGYFEAHPNLDYGHKDDFMRVQWLPLLLGDGPISSTVPVTPGVKDGIRDFIFRNMEPIKLAVWLTPIIAVIWTLWVQNNETRRQRTEIAAQNEINLKILHEASMADYAVAVKRIDQENKWHEGVAHLVRALKWEPGNPIAAARLYSTLSFYAGEKQTWPRHNLRHEGSVTSAQFSPDGTRIVTASNGTTAQVWDAATGKPLGEPLQHNLGVLSAQFNPDGTRIVTASYDNTARVWDAATGMALSEPLPHDSSVEKAQFSPDGTQIVTFSEDKTVRVWDAATGKLVGEPVRLGDDVKSPQFNSDATRIVTVSASNENTARVLDAATGKALGEPLLHELHVMSTQFSPDGTRVVTASFDNTAQVWDAETGKALGEPLVHDTIRGAQFSPDGTRIVTTSRDDAAKVWDVVSGKDPTELLGHEGEVTSAHFSSDGIRIVTVGIDNTARVWDAATGLPLGEPLRHESSVKIAEFSPEGTRIMTVSDDNTAWLWDAAAGLPLGEPLRHEHSVMSAQFSPDGSQIVTASGSNGSLGEAWVWDAATGKALGEPVHHVATRSDSVQFSPDKTRMVAVSRVSMDAPVQIRDTVTGEVIGEPLRHSDFVESALFSPDGNRIVTASYDTTARVWDAATGKALGEPLRHEDRVESAQFSPDGNRIVTACRDGTARLWDVSRLNRLPVPVPEWMRTHASALAGLCFTLDGELRAIPVEERITILREPIPRDAPWSALAQWVVLPAAERTVTPDSRFTRRHLAERERDTGIKEGIESALLYDPSVPLAHLLLAKFEDNPQRAAFLRDYGLKHLPDDAGFWSRAATSLVEQKDFKRAVHAAEKALKLDPLNSDAKKALKVARQGGGA